ncbi:MAG: hypothetical protein EXR05_01770 [Acetobacteraceae bacterium]|nr:hypothetical protein [Acetobacteraceae bacterium]
MPRLMDADRAARAILLGIARGRTRITFRWYIGVIGQLTALLPPRLFAALTVAHVARESGR